MLLNDATNLVKNLLSLHNKPTSLSVMILSSKSPSVEFIKGISITLVILILFLDVFSWVRKTYLFFINTNLEIIFKIKLKLCLLFQIVQHQ